MLISLYTNPFIAVVSWQIDAGCELEADEPLMIVRSRINKMAKNFLLGPLTGRRAHGRFIILLIWRNRAAIFSSDSKSFATDSMALLARPRKRELKPAFPRFFLPAVVAA